MAKCVVHTVNVQAFKRVTDKPVETYAINEN